MKKRIYAIAICMTTLSSGRAAHPPHHPKVFFYAAEVFINSLSWKARKYVLAYHCTIKKLALQTVPTTG